MRVVIEQRISAPPEHAFDAMADARNEVHWNSQVTRSELLSGEPVGQGSRFETVNRGQTYVASITTCERPTALAFTVTGKQLDISSHFALRPDGDGVALSGTFDFRPKGVMRLFLPLLARSIRSDMPKQMASFARFVERAGPTGGR